MSRHLSGHLLIASPYLSDSNFYRSVVLIVSHDDEHAFGLLLNRQGHGTLGEAWTEITGDPCERSERLRFGGPLDGPIMLLHENPDMCDSQLVPGVFISTTPESVAEVIDSESCPVVALTGYSGWGPGQLESELRVGGWMTHRATKEIVFTEPELMWSLASRNVSDTIMPHFNRRHTPADPRLN